MDHKKLFQNRLLVEVLCVTYMSVSVSDENQTSHGGYLTIPQKFNHV